jgi:glucosamine--fructose-6-phosphate aminotransferase (isomerizing)
MCGIVGAVADRNVVPVLIEGLKRLEYRGYDSAGVAVLNGSMRRVRSTGRVAELERQAQGISGKLGIAHTRWATHGAPSERNAHPHVSGGVSVVHNGIIENYEPMRARLAGQGYVFTSDTDTEVIAHLVHARLREGADLLEAVRRATGELLGAYAIAVISESEPDRLVIARMGAPLLIGLGDGGNFAASDVSALVQVTRRVAYLEDGDCAALGRDRVEILDREGRPVVRPERITEVTAAAMELQGFRHYMQKEIFEQPLAVANTLEMVSGAHSVSPALFGAGAEEILRGVTSVHIAACGTSFHAGLVARYWLEAIARIPARVEIASEYRYRESVPDPRGLFLVISQSGETADTLAALEHARKMGYAATLAICNVPESSLIRASRLRFLTRAGPEIGVASTKAFTTQLAALVLFVMVMARLRGRLTPEREAELLQALRHLPAAMGKVLQVEPQVKMWAEKFAGRHHALFLGRGIHWPIAMEGALKLKEISYIHAEAYAAGELKHGPLALVDKFMPVVAIAPNDALLEKLRSNLQEVRARGGELHVFADQDTRMAPAEGIHVIRMPDHAGTLSPILHVLPLQLLAYHTALERGNDVDKPRNLAKSVTVE